MSLWKARITTVLAISTTLATGALGVLAPGDQASTRGGANPAGDDIYSTVREAAVGLDQFTIYRPADLSKFERDSIPVMLWANGGCDRTSVGVAGYLEHIASAGYIVVAVGGLIDIPNGETTDPDVLISALDWVTESKEAPKQLGRKANTDKIAVMGRSCGGLQALHAGVDKRVKSVAALNSGYIGTQPRNGFDPANLAGLSVPTLWGNGGPTDQAYENSIRDFQNSPVPSVLVEASVGGHGAMTFGLQNGTFEVEAFWTGVQVAVNWLDFTLNGDSEAGRYLIGPDCGVCAVPDWTAQSKGF